MVKYFSMFSGIGGFERGIGELGECIGYSEIDKYAIKVYERQFNGLRQSENKPQNSTDSEGGTSQLPRRSLHRNFGDATTINPADLPDFDLLVGGFPCQAFSVAGKRAGFNDTRGTLFFEIARILKHKRPRHLVLENVKGLLSHDGGKTFATILGVLSDLGYYIEWQVLNSKDFGVPQNRERVFIVGHLGDGCRPKVFPIRPSSQPNSNPQQDISSALDANYWKGPSKGFGGRGRQMIDIVGTLETDGWEKRHEQIRRVHGTDGISPTIPTGLGGGVMTKVAVPMQWRRSAKGRKIRAENQKNGRDYTPFSDDARELVPIERDHVGAITSQAIAKDSLLSDNLRIRRLTPKECMRLQGFPDDWCDFGSDGLPISDTQKYKMAGNAVTVNVVQAVMEKLL